MPSVSAIVVSYNTAELLRACLESLGEADELIVVDNASVDGSPEVVLDAFPNAKLIVNPVNQGFGSAVNQGLDAMTSDLAIVLNADIRAKPGAIARLADAVSVEGTVAAGGKLLFPDGEVQQSTTNALTLWAVFCEQTGLEKIFPSSRIFSPYWTTHRLLREKPDEKILPVVQVMGACLMMRPLERFDERFFLYCEDTELCRRLSGHGKIVYVPGAEFTHALGAASSSSRWRAVALYNRGKQLYFKIHHGSVHAAICFLLNFLGALLRFAGYGLATILTLGLSKKLRTQALTFARVLAVALGADPLPSDSSRRR